MGKNLSEHKASVRWVNRHWKGLAGVNSPMEWRKEATFRGFRKHLHFTQKRMPQDMPVVVEYWDNDAPFFGEVDNVDVSTLKVTRGWESKKEKIVHIR